MDRYQSGVGVSIGVTGVIVIVTICLSSPRHYSLQYVSVKSLVSKRGPRLRLGCRCDPALQTSLCTYRMWSNTFGAASRSLKRLVVTLRR